MHTSMTITHEGLLMCKSVSDSSFTLVSCSIYGCRSIPQLYQMCCQLFGGHYVILQDNMLRHLTHMCPIAFDWVGLLVSAVV